jgi:sugar-specific transcriptional regulator TrmB
MPAQKDRPHYPSLVKLGLSPDETECYGILLSEGAQSAKEISDNIEILPNAVYRLIERLKLKGFVVELDTHPAKFQAIPPEVAVPAYTKKKIKEIEEYQAQSLTNLASPERKSQANVEIITGRKAMFIKGAEMISQAVSEVLIISIGEPVPDEIKIANRDALQRGVVIKFIAHQLGRSNHSLLESWKKMGLEVRHHPGSGYHLSIIDSKQCLLAASNPDDPAERVSMLINNEGLTEAMKNYFYSLWKKSVPID